jgi:SAM-dependent methyltransferase
VQAEYYRVYAAEQNHWWFSARRRILEAVMTRALPTTGSSLLLEVGTGTGAMGHIFSRFGHFVGLDNNWLALEQARAKVEHLVGGRVEELPFRPSSMDAVCAYDILEHVEDDRGALRELRRVVKAEGKLLVTVPAFPFLWTEHDEVNHHRRRYTKASLGRALEDSGWRIERLTYFNTILFPAIAGARLMLRQRSSGRPPRSDFVHRVPPLLNRFLEAAFAVERHVVPLVDLPFGVSLLGIGTPG